MEAPANSVWRWWLVGGAGRSVGIIWWFGALAADDAEHIVRLAPAAALWLSKIVWGLAALHWERATTAGSDTTSQSTASAIASQAFPAMCAIIMTTCAWGALWVPPEIRLGFSAEETQEIDSVVSAVSVEVVASVAFGIFLGGITISAPEFLYFAGLLRCSWPPDPVPGLEAQHAADLVEKVRLILSFTHIWMTNTVRTGSST